MSTLGTTRFYSSLQSPSVGSSSSIPREVATHRAYQPALGQPSGARTWGHRGGLSGDTLLFSSFTNSAPCSTDHLGVPSDLCEQCSRYNSASRGGWVGVRVRFCARYCATANFLYFGPA